VDVHGYLKVLKKREYCEFKSKKEQFVVKFQGTEQEKIIPPEDMCFYYNQKFQALSASHSVFNYSSFFQTKKYSSGIEDLLDKNCLIADESHEIEREIIRFIGYDIKKSHLDDVKWTFTPYDLENTESVIKLVNDLYTRYIEEVKAMEEFQKPPPLLSKFKKREEKLQRLLEDMSQNSENFVVQPDNPDPEKTKSLSIKPLEINQYVNEFFNYENQIFLSATIDKIFFCKNMGLNEEKCALIEVPKSPFPLKNRTVEFCNIHNMNRKSSDNEWGKMYKEIDRVMKKHGNEKGLILTSSISQCQKIKSNLSQDSRDRLVLVFEQLGKHREEILESHKNSHKPLVLLSPSLWVGVDLKDDLSRFQIIVKTPYPPLSDKRIKMKMKNNYVWYQYETLTRLLQGLGRSVRHDKDFAITYVLDGKAEILIKEMKKYVPKSYYDILGWNSSTI